MVKISPKTRAALIFGLLLCVASLGVFGGMWFMIDRAKLRLTEAQQAHASLIEEERSLASLERLVAETADDRTELTQYVLDQSEFVSFLSLIEKVGTESGVVVSTKSIVASDIPNESGFEAVLITLELSGEYEALRHVLDLFEHLPYQSRVESISLDRMGEESAEWRVQMELRVTKIKL